jgi:hypothetical protein
MSDEHTTNLADKAEQDRLKRIFDSALDDARTLAREQVLQYSIHQREKCKILSDSLNEQRVILRAYTMVLKSLDKFTNGGGE